MMTLPAIAQRWHAQMCQACGRGILSIKGQSLWLNYTQTKTSFNYDDLIVSSVQDIYSFNCMVNTVLTDQTLIVLDNKLTKIKSLNLVNLGIIRPTQVALEGSQYAWIYDSYQNKLMKISIGLGIIDQTIDLNCICDSIREMIYQDNRLFFACKKGIFSLDNMLNFDLKHRGGVEDFIIYQDRVIFLIDGAIIDGQDTIARDKHIKHLYGLLEGKIIVGGDKSNCFSERTINLLK